MKEIIIKLSDQEYALYVKKGQSAYRQRVGKDEDYARWIFTLGEYYRGQRD
jgi:hypothetical protein